MVVGEPENTKLINNLITSLSDTIISEEDLKDLYNEVSPKGWSLPEANPEKKSKLTNIIENLSVALKQSDGSHPLLNFVIKLHEKKPITNFDEWIKQACEIYDTSTDILLCQNNPASAETKLLVKIEEIKENKVFRIASWVFCYKYPKGRPLKLRDEELILEVNSLSEVSDSINMIYNKAWNELTSKDSKDLIITFILPIKHISHKVHNSLIDKGLGEYTEVGRSYCVTIRPFERVYKMGTPIFEQCKDRWNKFQTAFQITNCNDNTLYIFQHIKESINKLLNKLNKICEMKHTNVLISSETDSKKIVFRFEPFHIDNLPNKLNDENYICLLLVNTVEKELKESVLKKIINSGIPVIIWVDQEIQQSTYQDILKLLLPTQNIPVLPKVIKTHRNNSSCEIFLLWDNFNFLPPDITNPFTSPKKGA